MATRQTTLPDYGLFDPIPLVTTPPRYLHENDRPTTHPTFIDLVGPTPPRDHTEPREPPGEQAPLHAFETHHPQPRWQPNRDRATPRACDRCGEHVSTRFKEVWADEYNYLDGCPSCLPRSVRFGEDVYDRNLAEAEAEFTAPVNR